jgi:hypothetical protein
MTNVVRHGFNSLFVIIFRLSDCLTALLTVLVVCDDQIWSHMFLGFGHNLPLTAFASDVALTSTMAWQLTWD